MIPSMAILGFGILSGIIFVFASLCVPIAFAMIMQKRIGGFTGDVLGAVSVVSEITGLMAISYILLS